MPFYPKIGKAISMKCFNLNKCFALALMACTAFNANSSDLYATKVFVWQNSAFMNLSDAVTAMKSSKVPEQLPLPVCTQQNLSWIDLNSCGFRYIGVPHVGSYTSIINDDYFYYVQDFEWYTADGQIISGGYLQLESDVACPADYDVSPRTVIQSGGQQIQKYWCVLQAPEREPKDCPAPGSKPIHASTGIEDYFEVDFDGGASSHLRYERNYRSDKGTWAHNYSRGAADLNAMQASAGSSIVAWPLTFIRNAVLSKTANGTHLGSQNVASFKLVGDSQSVSNNFGIVRQNQNLLRFGTTSQPLTPPAGVHDTVAADLDAAQAQIGWRVSNASEHSLERYDMTGRLQSIAYMDGQSLQFTYSSTSTQASTAPSAGLLLSVTDLFGRQIQFTYNPSGLLASMTDPAGRQTKYFYDESSSISVGSGSVKNLTSVIYPDGTKKIYWYNEQGQTSATNFPNAWTGITDENGSRYASIIYDSSGRAVSSGYALNAQIYSFQFNQNSTVVIDPLGTMITQNFQNVGGFVLPAGSNRPGGSGCTASSSALSYDANGNVLSKTDFDGRVTSYGYDSVSNLEVQRVEAAGTPQARTISKNWHAYWRMPTVVAEPAKLTTMVFNGDTYNGSVVSCAPANATVLAVSGGIQPIGVLCQKIEQATSDLNGSQGFAAARVGSPSVRAYTYNAFGQVIAAQGPRTEVSDITTYSYYPDTAFTGSAPVAVGHTIGDLYTITGPSGLTTTFDAYDKAGRVLQMTDPKGIVTTMTYTPRGWINTVGVTPPGGASRVTTYTYDFVGQVTGVSNPDGTTIGYTYDVAHRLIGATDAKGNSVNYTLDNMGNRIAEQLKDPGGVLQRTMSRSFDALNRVQQLQLQ